MRVVFDTHRDFLREITVDSHRVRDGIVRARVDRVPEQPEAITFAVWMGLSAVIEDESGSYLLEFNAYAGSDDEANPQAGTETAARWSKDLAEAIDATGLELRPGKIEFP